MGTISVSAGSAFRAVYREGRRSPSGSIGRLVIQSDTGAVLAEFIATQQDGGFFFNEPASAVANVPHGAHYSFFVTNPGSAPFMASYGTVVRAEPSFALGASGGAEYSVHYEDNFASNYISPTWISVGGSNSLELHTVGFSPPTMGPKFSLFSSAATLWYAPLTMDSVTVQVNLFNHGAGKFNVAVCSDYSMSSYIGIQWETGVVNNRLWVIKGTSPTTWTYVGSAVNHVTEHNSLYKVVYNFSTNTITCSKSGSTIITGSGSGISVPHGAGFRYTGMSWNTALLSPGVEPSSWSARDGVV